MNILLTINELYIAKVSALINSIKRNVSEPCNVYLIYNDISEEGISRLKKMCVGGEFITCRNKISLHTCSIATNAWEKLEYRGLF